MSHPPSPTQVLFNCFPRPTLLRLAGVNRPAGRVLQHRARQWRIIQHPAALITPCTPSHAWPTQQRCSAPGMAASSRRILGPAPCPAQIWVALCVLTLGRAALAQPALFAGAAGQAAHPLGKVWVACHLSPPLCQQVSPHPVLAQAGCHLTLPAFLFDVRGASSSPREDWGGGATERSRAGTVADPALRDTCGLKTDYSQWR